MRLKWLDVIDIAESFELNVRVSPAPRARRAGSALGELRICVQDQARVFHGINVLHLFYTIADIHCY